MTFYVTTGSGVLVSLGLLFIAAGMLRWLHGEYRTWRETSDLERKANP